MYPVSMLQPPDLYSPFPNTLLLSLGLSALWVVTPESSTHHPSFLHPHLVPIPEFLCVFKFSLPPLLLSPSLPGALSSVLAPDLPLKQSLPLCSSHPHLQLCLCHDPL